MFRVRAARRGVAATETAVLLPVVVMIAFAAIELANGFYLKQSLTLGAYEAASVLSASESKSSVAEEACGEILRARGVSSFAMSVSPNPQSKIDAGELITVKVAAPADAFAIGANFFLRSREVTSEVTVVRTP